MVTSGGMTGRLDKLAAAGLVERIPHPTDKRHLLVQLTGEGVELVDAAVTAQTKAQRYVLEALGRERVEDLSNRLRELLDIVARP
jgi:DNA-binding MarR family transcriptional regulator